MKHRTSSHRVLGIDPTTRGLGFSVLEGPGTLVDWGVKSARSNKNTRCLEHVKDLITLYRPCVLVLEDATAKDSRRCPRVRVLLSQVVSLSRAQAVRVKQFSSGRVKKSFATEGAVTKHEIATIIARRFPEEFRFRLPTKRKPWMSEDYRTGIFDAVALALTFFVNQTGTGKDRRPYDVSPH